MAKFTVLGQMSPDVLATGKIDLNADNRTALPWPRGMFPVIPVYIAS